MPLYEYQCKKCSHIFEREHAIGEKKKYRCPECASSQTRKIISQVGVVFKGSGFYVTDNRKLDSGVKTASNNGKSKNKKTTTAKSKSDSTTPASEN